MAHMVVVVVAVSGTHGGGGGGGWCTCMVVVHAVHQSGWGTHTHMWQSQVENEY